MSTETEPQTEYTPTQKQSSAIGTIAIILASLVLALGTYAIRRYDIESDRRIGEEKMKSNQADAHGEEGAHSSASIRQQQLELEHRLSDSLTKNPADTSLLLPLGSARLALGDTLGALAMYERYLDKNPASSAARSDYGYLLFIMGKQDEGRQQTLHVLKKEPKNQIAMYNMAAMSYKENKLDDALAWMKKCVDADSSSTIGGMAREGITQLEHMKSKQNPSK